MVWEVPVVLIHAIIEKSDVSESNTDPSPAVTVKRSFAPSKLRLAPAHTPELIRSQQSRRRRGRVMASMALGGQTFWPSHQPQSRHPNGSHHGRPRNPPIHLPPSRDCSPFPSNSSR